MQVKESFDPLLKHWLAVARDKETRPADFKAAIQNITKIALFECADRVIPTKRTQVQTPMDAPAEAQYVDSSNPVCIVPVLRAGLVMSEALEAIMPVSVTYHLGYVRDEETLEATPYLNKLPESFDSNSKILLLDIMIATGGTICQALDELLERGAKPSNIQIICVVAAAPALEKMIHRYEGVGLTTAAIDLKLNERGYIVPGLGDAGDRSYGTL